MTALWVGVSVVVAFISGWAVCALFAANRDETALWHRRLLIEALKGIMFMAWSEYPIHKATLNAENTLAIVLSDEACDAEVLKAAGPAPKV